MWPPDCQACVFYDTVDVYLVWLKSISCGQTLTAETAIVVKMLLSPSTSLPLSTRGLYEQYREMFASSDIGRTERALGTL